MGAQPGMRLGATAALLLGLPGAAEGAWYGSLVAQLRVPPGFKVDVYGEVPAARSLAVAPSGTVFVGAYDFSGIQGDDGREVAVYALRDLDGNGDALGPGEAIAVTEEMACPNGVAFLGTDLYVAQRHRILKYSDVETNIEKRKRPTVLIGQENPIDSGNGLPNTHWHGWRYIKANPRTNKIYVAIGSPCNVPDNGEVQDCANTRRHPLLGSIAEIDPLSSRPGLTVVAHGIRNSLGLAFHPDNDDMWFSKPSAAALSLRLLPKPHGAAAQPRTGAISGAGTGTSTRPASRSSKAARRPRTCRRARSTGCRTRR